MAELTSPRRTRGVRHRLVLPWVALVGAWFGNACLSDVEIPECMRTNTCSEGGEGGSDANRTGGTGNGGSLPGTSGNAMSSPGGEGPGGGSGGSTSAGGSVSSGGTSVTAGAGESNEGGAPLAGMSNSAGDAGSAGDGECPNCVFGPKELTPPCAGKPYRSTLMVTGGRPPYRWRVESALDGWSISVNPDDSSVAVLRAIEAPLGKSTVTVRATSSNGLEARITYVTHAREACWFAYTSTDVSDGQKLALLDPLAEEAAPAQLSHNSAVYDFRFSPDGRYLAYRYGADSQFKHGRHLALVNLTTLAEQELPFGEDAVTAYAWAPDSSVLAAGFVAADKKYVSGARLPSAGSSGSPTMLSAAASYVEEELFWVGNGFVAYSAELLPDPANPGEFLPNPDHRRAFSFLELGAGGFASANFTVENFSPDVVSRPASDGFWVSDGTLTIFYPVPGGSAQSATHLEPVLIAPNGRSSASFFDGPLEVFAAASGYPIVLAAPKPDEDCGKVLAWSGKDQIACVTDVDAVASSSHGEVRFFDLVPGNDVLQMSSLGGFCEGDVSVVTPDSCSSQTNRYGYTEALAQGAPRGFSRAGNWFAFTRSSGDDSYLYWVNVGIAPLTLHSLPLRGAPKRLAFSPDEQKLAIQSGVELTIQDLNGAHARLDADGGVRSVESCSEQFPTAPANYCGDTERVAPFKWASDSGALAYLSADSLRVAAVHDGFATRLNTTRLCEKALCSGDFAFQPLITSADP